MNPIGPEEPSTYWRRRAIVIVVLLVLVWLAWMALSAVMGGSNSAAAQAPDASPSFGLSLSESPSDDDSAGATASGSQDPSDSASADPSDSASSSASGSASSTQSPSPSGSASPTGGACASSDLVVTAVPGATSVPAGSGTSLAISVANTGTAACSRDVGSGANEIQVLSGGKVVYSTDDCNPSTASKEVDVAPGTPWTATVTWDGRASASGCASGQAAVPAGTYQVVARNGSITSDPITITVQ